VNPVRGGNDVKVRRAGHARVAAVTPEADAHGLTGRDELQCPRDPP
jgi:hypothetical protein